MYPRLVAERGREIERESEIKREVGSYKTSRERKIKLQNCAFARTRKDIRRFAHCTKSVTISKLQNVLNQRSDTWWLLYVNWLRWRLRLRRSLTMQHAARKGAKQTNETKSPIVALYGLLNLIGLLCFSRWMVSHIHSPDNQLQRQTIERACRAVGRK